MKYANINTTSLLQFVTNFIRIKDKKPNRRISKMTNEKRMKHAIKCKYCGKSDHVEYLAGLDWFCNKRCHYNYRHIEDKM